MIHKKHSLRHKILVPLIFMIVLEGVLIYTVIYLSGTMQVLKGNAYGIFEEIVQSRASNLNNDMVNYWSEFDEDLENIQQEMENFLLDNGISGNQLVPGSELTAGLLVNLAPDLIAITQKNHVTGVFLVAEGDGSEKKSGLYFRDLNPESNKLDYSDLVAIRGPSAVTKKMGISLDSQWTPGFTIHPEGGNYAYYNYPVQTAKQNQNLDNKDLGYWCAAFPAEGSDTQGSKTITYSVPILVGGTVEGIMGVEVTNSYLSGQLPYMELNEGEKAGYLLIKKEGDGYKIMVSSQGAGLGEIQEETRIKAEPSEWNGFYEISGQGIPEKCLVCMKQLKLYNSNVPYEKEEWFLAGAVQQPVLLAFFNRFEKLIFYVVAASILLAMAAAALAAHRLTRPITALNRKLKHSNKGKRIRLDEIQIAEIDDLTNTIEKLSNEVVDNASKLATILDMAGVSIGACEYTKGKENEVYCTREFLKIFRYPGECTEGLYLSAKEMQNWLKQYESCVIESKDEEQSVILELKEEHPGRWIRFQKVYTGSKMLGVASDITRDMIEKKKMEHERDFDLLTNLYNRRAFQAKTSACFLKKEDLGLAAMAMIDLDNLKYINDSYGHDCGDEYIRTAAEVIRRHRDEYTIFGRLSGDEFLVFFYGNRTKEQIRLKMQKLFEEFHKTDILLPDGTRMPVRASVGMAWYPKDADNLEELRMYADFAMYMVKKTNKGDLAEFDPENYRRESYLLHCREELNLLLEQKRVNYAFQPIVDCKTGEIFAYEALMRPDSKNIQNPMTLLSLARSQSKLYQVEKLTMFKAMDEFTKLDFEGDKPRIFINSIANQVLTDEELQEFERRFQEYLSRIVIEITEEEHSTDFETKKKKKICREWGAEIAVDDYGEGYSNESILLELNPNYMKLDQVMIHDIHKKPKQMSLLRSILSFTKAHGIKTVAEGVECKEELEMLVQEGIDYLQGFYVAKPEFGPQRIVEKIKEEILCAGKNTL